jgi:hypothetical protein
MWYGQSVLWSTACAGLLLLLLLLMAASTAAAAVSAAAAAAAVVVVVLYANAAAHKYLISPPDFLECWSSHLAGVPSPLLLLNLRC